MQKDGALIEEEGNGELSKEQVKVDSRKKRRYEREYSSQNEKHL